MPVFAAGVGIKFIVQYSAAPDHYPTYVSTFSEYRLSCLHGHLGRTQPHRTLQVFVKIAQSRHFLNTLLHFWTCAGIVIAAGHYLLPSRDSEHVWIRCVVMVSLWFMCSPIPYARSPETINLSGGIKVELATCRHWSVSFIVTFEVGDIISSRLTYWPIVLIAGEDSFLKLYFHLLLFFLFLFIGFYFQNMRCSDKSVAYVASHMI